MSVALRQAAARRRADYAAAVMADNPTAYWRLGEGSGSSCADSSGNGWTGTAAGSYTRGAAGLIPGDLSLSVAGGGYVATTYAGSPSEATLSALIRPTSVTGYHNILDHDNESTGRYLQWRLNGAALELAWWTPTTGPHFVAGGTLTANTAVHVATRVTTSGAWLYINGTEVGSVAQAGGLKTSGTSRAWWLAAHEWQTTHGPVQLFNGTLDEPAIFSTALAPSRVLAHAQAGGFA